MILGKQSGCKGISNLRTSRLPAHASAAAQMLLLLQNGQWAGSARCFYIVMLVPALFEAKVCLRGFNVVVHCLIQHEGGRRLAKACPSCFRHNRLTIALVWHHQASSPSSSTQRCANGKNHRPRRNTAHSTPSKGTYCVVWLKQLVRPWYPWYGTILFWYSKKPA